MNFRFARAQLFTQFSMEVKIVRREWIRKREKRLGELKHYSFQLGGLGGWVGSQPDNRVEKIHLLTLNHFEKDTTSRSLIYFLHSNWKRKKIEKKNWKNGLKVGLEEIEKSQKSIFQYEILNFKVWFKNLVKNTWPKEQFLLEQKDYLLVKNQTWVSLTKRWIDWILKI